MDAASARRRNPTAIERTWCFGFFWPCITAKRGPGHQCHVAAKLWPGAEAAVQPEAWYVGDVSS
jgi:hypothetical protein